MGHNCEQGCILSMKNKKDSAMGEPGFATAQEIIVEEKEWVCELEC